MKRSQVRLGQIFGAVLAVSMLTAPIVVQARDHDHDRRAHNERRDRHEHRRDDRHEHRWDRDRREHHAHRHDDRRWRDYDRHHHRNDHRDERRAYVQGYRHGRYDAGRYYRPAGYRAYTWHRGARLPAAYCAPRYIVHDYGHYRLHRPPHGHHWIRVDHDVVLAAVATGAVVAVVNNLFH